MKTLLKLFSALTLTALLASTANAALITQRLLEVTDEGSADIGFITIDTSGAEIDEAFGTGYVTAAVEFNFLGLVDIPQTDILFFEAVFDVTNWFAGLEMVSFDVDVSLVDWAFDGLADIYDPEGGSYTVFNGAGELLYANGLALGSVSVVSEPAGIALFATVLGLIAWRRRKLA